jgi:hypothetical protein
MDVAIAETVTAPRSRAQFLRELAEFKLPHEPERVELITEATLGELPQSVQRYLRFMRVPCRPRVWSFLARTTGSFRRSPREAWAKYEAWQHNSRLGVSRVYQMRLRLHRVLPVTVRDTYVGGEGRMSGRLFDAFNIVDQHDERIAIGELSTYLNDALLFAPSMLLGPATTWTELGERAFEVTLTDRDRSVCGRVITDERGAMTEFSTIDRFGVDPARNEMVRACWSTAIDGYHLVTARPVPIRARAIWHFDSGDFEYGDLRCTELQLNIT